MSSLTGFINVFKRELFSATRKNSVKTLATILIIFALEQMLTRTNIYQCPEKGHQVYGAMFILVPAFCLSGLTLLTSSSFWDSATSRFRAKYENRLVCLNVCYAIIKALLVGIAWLVLAFGTTDFYACFRVGPNVSATRSGEIKAQSTLLAWAIIALIIVAGLVYIAILQCCCRQHDRECAIQTLRDYERLETEAAVSKFEEGMQKLAKKRGEEQVMAILNEVEDGKSAREVVKKAKRLMLEKYSAKTCTVANGCENGSNGINDETGTEEKQLITTV